MSFQKGELSSDYAEYGFDRRLAEISKETDKVALALWAGVLTGPAIFDLIRHPKLLDIAEQFCGPELIASSVYRLRPKVPNHANSPVPWHQDSAYCDPYCDRELILTVWLPLVDATRENGCMWVLPKVHKGDVLPHRQIPDSWYIEIAPQHLPKVDPVCLPLRKGSALLLTNRTPHATFENKSETVRWSIDVRYQSAALPTNAAITRLPGESRPDSARGIPLACYAPEADFLVRSRLRPNEVVTNPARFRAIRSQHLAVPPVSRW